MPCDFFPLREVVHISSAQGPWGITQKLCTSLLLTSYDQKDLRFPNGEKWVSYSGLLGAQLFSATWQKGTKASNFSHALHIHGRALAVDDCCAGHEACGKWLESVLQ